MARHDDDDRKRRISRREALRAAGALAGAAALGGCGTGSDEDEDDDGGSVTKGDDASEAARCSAPSGLSDAKLLEPIEHIVVLMMENRSFDHYFGSLSLLEGRTDVDGLVGGEFNLGPGGERVESFPMTNPFVSPPPHTWEAMHGMWNNGKNDGFCLEHHKENGATNPQAFREVMQFMRREDLPIHYALADAYALCDKYHCSLLGPTWPNRFYMHAATSGGRQSNLPRPFLTTIWDLLDDADLEGINYFSDVPWAAAALGKVFGFDSMSDFFEDAEDGNLPPFSIIDPGFFRSSEHPGFGGSSEHPEMGPNFPLGSLFISLVYSALANSPNWNKTLFIITYDESGGFYDHVAPPVASDERADFRRHGFRIPGIVIGPHVRKGCAIHTLFDHSSIISTAATRFGLEIPNERAAAASTFASCIDPDFLNKPQPGIRLPKIEIDEDQLLDNLFPDAAGAPELWQLADQGAVPAKYDRRKLFREDTKSLIRKAREYELVYDRIRWGTARRP
jgi:phospholipase C